MYTDVFIGLAHDEKFDFDTEGNVNGNMPTILYRNPCGEERRTGEDKIYWDLVNNPLCKKLDWGSWGLKRSAIEMAALLRVRYASNCYAQYLIDKITKDFIDNGLGDVELVLDAVEF